MCAHVRTCARRRQVRTQVLARLRGHSDISGVHMQPASVGMVPNLDGRLCWVSDWFSSAYSMDNAKRHTPAISCRPGPLCLDRKLALALLPAQPSVPSQIQCASAAAPSPPQPHAPSPSAAPVHRDMCRHVCRCVERERERERERDVDMCGNMCVNMQRHVYRYVHGHANRHACEYVQRQLCR